MGGVRGFALSGLMMTLLVGTACAASVEGELRVSGFVALSGSLAAEGDALDLGRAAHEGAPLSITWERAEGLAVTRVRSHVGPDQATGAWSTGSTSEEALDLGPATATFSGCPIRCRVALFPRGSGVVGAEGTAALTLSAIEEEEVMWGGFADADATDSFYYAAPPTATALRTDPMSFADASPFAHGSARLFLWNVTMTVDGIEWWTGTRTSPLVDPLPLVPAAAMTETSRFIVLDLEGAEVSSPPGAGLDLYANDPILRLDGIAEASHVDGVVEADGRRVLRDDLIRIEGRIELDGGYAPRAAGPLGGPAKGPFVATLRGDAARFEIAGEAPAIRASAGLSPAVPLVLLLIGAAWALYTRILPSTILENPNRERLYAMLGIARASGVAELARAANLNETVVRHHLRILEQHQMVAAHGAGKARVYVRIGDRAAVDSAGRIATLRDDTRRAIAHALIDTELPPSQRDISVRTGLPQRIVSYHLERLAAEGLLTREGTMPRRYRATEALRRSFALVHEA